MLWFFAASGGYCADPERNLRHSLRSERREISVSNQETRPNFRAIKTNTTKPSHTHTKPRPGPAAGQADTDRQPNRQ